MVSVDNGKLNFRTYCVGYVKELMSELLEVFASGRQETTLTVTDSLCSEFQRPNKKTAIKEKQTRFALCAVR